MITGDPAPEAAGVARVLVVDDEEPMRRILTRILSRMSCTCTVAENVDQALGLLSQDSFDLVLADMNMPGPSGLDLIVHIHEHYPTTATVMVTGVDDPKLAYTALQVGAYGYVIKPFEANEISIAVANALRRRTLEVENRNHRERLEELVKGRTTGLWDAIRGLEHAQQDVRRSQEDTIYRLSAAAEYRHDETPAHIRRMSGYCALLTRALGADEEETELVRVASVMHDVGKIGIPDHILLKPGPLDPDEREVMQGHCEIGFKILDGSDSELLKLASTIALTHHEHVDGGGYPRGLKRKEIPKEGRVAAVADVFDALTTNRFYRKAYPLGEALEIIKEGRRSQFDPVILDTFLDNIDEVLRIYEAER